MKKIIGSIIASLLFAGSITADQAPKYYLFPFGGWIACPVMEQYLPCSASQETIHTYLLIIEPTAASNYTLTVDTDIDTETFTGKINHGSGYFIVTVNGVVKDSQIDLEP